MVTKSRIAKEQVAAPSGKRRQRVNLSVRSDYIDEARKANINLSKALEETLTARLKQERERRWLEENQEAIAAYNAYIEKYGLWHRGLTDWY